jgi:prevent-host-death family protein
LSQLVKEVEETGERVVLQRHGKDVAVLVPVEAVYQPAAKRTAEETIGGLRELQEAQLDRGFKPLRGGAITRFVAEGRKW